MGSPAVRALTRFSRLALYFVWFLAVAGCGRDGSRQATLDGSPTSLVQHIDLDAVSTDTVMMTWSTTRASGPDTANLGTPAGFVIVDDSLYIADTQRSTILVADADLHIRRRIGELGEGPGEFINPFDVASIGDSVLVVFEAARVQLVDVLGNHITMLAGHRSMTHGVNDANGAWILAPSGGADSSFVKAYASSSPTDPPVPFLHIPETQIYHPGAYQVAIAEDNTSVFGVARNVPIVEIFDGGLIHVKTLVLDGRVVDDFRRDPYGGRDTVPRRGGFVAFFQFLGAECDDLLLIGRANAAWFIRRVGDSFELAGRAVFVAEDEEGVISITEIQIVTDRAYVSSYRRGAIYSGDLPPALSCTGDSSSVER